MKASSVIGVINLILLLPHTVLGQATFQFQNLDPTSGIDAPIFDAQGVPLEGTNYWAELYGGPTPDALKPACAMSFSPRRVAAPFFTGTYAGYFRTSETVAVPDAAPGGFAWLQVRVWDARLGATYEDVLARGLGGYGESALFYARGGGASANGDLPGPLIGLQSFRQRLAAAALMRSIRQEGQQVIIEWNPGFKRYQRQQTSSLDQPWQNLGDPTAATTVTNSIGTAQQFFRVIGLLD